MNGCGCWCFECTNRNAGWHCHGPLCEHRQKRNARREETEMDCYYHGYSGGPGGPCNACERENGPSAGYYKARAQLAKDRERAGLDKPKPKPET